jgi:Zn-dependent protease
VQVAAAGPVSNLILCVAAALVLRLLLALPPVFPGTTATLFRALGFALQINLALAFFNLIPVHPLDGSKILAGLLPLEWSLSYERHAPFGVAIIMALLFTGVLRYLVAVPSNIFLILLTRVLGLA